MKLDKQTALFFSACVALLVFIVMKIPDAIEGLNYLIDMVSKLP